ncbi:MAG TPA: hypothetical protein VMQ60_10420 [Acidobacteriaceae bacterium]|nr:hypothetical protein [Acidobacteriaceae bacterium]
MPLNLPSAPGMDAAKGLAEEENRLSPSDSAKRNSLMQPGIEALKQGNNKTAYVSLNSVLTAYPNDLYALRTTAAAAMGAGQYEEAIVLFRRALTLSPHNPWPLRNAVILLEARLKQWNDFDHDMGMLRTAKKNGMEHGLDDSSGFVIDQFDVGPRSVQGELYPLQPGQYHTLYRFVLPPGEIMTTVRASSASKAIPAQCNNPDFRPHLDVESADVDQTEFKKAYPDKAAKGERSYTLIVYGSPCAQALAEFYPDGEPTYEKARADAIRVLTSPEQR